MVIKFVRCRIAYNLQLLDLQRDFVYTKSLIIRLASQRGRNIPASRRLWFFYVIYFKMCCDHHVLWISWHMCSVNNYHLKSVTSQKYNKFKFPFPNSTLETTSSTEISVNILGSTIPLQFYNCLIKWLWLSCKKTTGKHLAQIEIVTNFQYCHFQYFANQLSLFI